MNILLPDPLHPTSLERLRALHEVRYDPTLSNRPDELIAAAPWADAIIVRNRVQVRGPLLEALSRCKAVGRLGVGLDNIDVEACRARGMAVIPATGANARSVAEYVVSATLQLRRGPSFLVSDDVRAGRWTRGPLPLCREIAGATLGIVGFGSIGQLTASLAKRLDMRVVASSPRPPKELLPELADVPLLPLEELLRTSDVVSLHVPLTEATRGLIGAKELAAMKPGSVLVNTARGAVVDAVALVEAVRSGHLAGAAVDVFDVEPLPAGSAWGDAPANLLLTPHIGSFTVESEFRVCELVTERLIETLERK